MSSALAFRNLADAGSLAASSGAARMPVSLLQNVHVARKWRSLDGAAQFLICDLGSLQMLDTIGLFGLTLALGHVARIRVSALDNTGLVGDR
ncbi:hypothetical protein ASE61_00690 [Bosea sp. Root670]|uniref:hypothetical protein n=1 Tax=Bosea sp. Root670 TaxID=1736583 RepID=UPI000714807F|nr:hypothetical protein [Bosea sp. Root670]KRE08168.1 hypothetical protein ASE61_00690 [Bosea sp. Root670]